MIFDIGYMLLVTAMLLSLYGMIIGFWGGHKRLPHFMQSSFHAVYAVAGLTLIASIILW